LGKKRVAAHLRSWKVGEDLERPSHREGLLKIKPRAAAGALPPGLVGLADTGVEYFKIFAAGGRSVHRETVRLVFLVELFGEQATRAQRAARSTSLGLALQGHARARVGAMPSRRRTVPASPGGP